MRSNSTIHVASLTITLSGETNTWASVVINGKMYGGDVGSPDVYWSEKREHFRNPETWIDDSLLIGLYQLSEEDMEEVVQAIGFAMM